MLNVLVSKYAQLSNHYNNATAASVSNDFCEELI